MVNWHGVRPCGSSTRRKYILSTRIDRSIVSRDTTRMEPDRELLDDLYRERVLRARRTPPEEKLLEGPRLFDLACRIMADGIRDENPGVDEQRVQELLTQRLAL